MDRRKSRNLILVLGLAMVLLAPAPGLAQWYAGVYGGVNWPHDAEASPTERLAQDIINEAAEQGVVVSALSVSISDVEFDEGFMVGGRVGYWLESVPFFGAEAELYAAFPEVSAQNVTLGTSLTADGSSGSPTVVFSVGEADLDVLTAGINVIARWPFGPIQPYGGAGLGIMHAEVDDIRLPQGGTISVGGTSFTYEPADVLFRNDDDTTAALQLIGGVRGFLSDNLALFAEYKWVTTELEFHNVEFDYDASHVYGGVEVYFGSGVQ